MFQVYTDTTLILRGLALLLLPALTIGTLHHLAYSVQLVRAAVERLLLI
jgi:hypothetical protein